MLLCQSTRIKFLKSGIHYTPSSVTDATTLEEFCGLGLGASPSPNYLHRLFLPAFNWCLHWNELGVSFSPCWFDCTFFVKNYGLSREEHSIEQWFKGSKKTHRKSLTLYEWALQHWSCDDIVVCEMVSQYLSIFIDAVLQHFVEANSRDRTSG